MNASTASTAAAAIIDAFKGEAAAAQGYVIAYVESARAVDNGESKASIAAAIKASGSSIKAGADLVGDFVLTAPLVAGDDGVAAAEWVRGKFGADTVKRVHTIVTSARVAKGQGTPVVRSILAPVVAILTEGESEPGAYAAAVARALTALSKVKPVQIDDTDTDDIEQDGAGDVEQDGAGEDGEPTADAMLQALSGPTVALRDMLENGAEYDRARLEAWLREVSAIARIHANTGAAAA